MDRDSQRMTSRELRIVVGVASLAGDPEGGDPVLPHAAEIARRLDAALHVIHVYEPPGFLLLDPAAAQEFGGGEDLFARHAAQKQAALERWLSEQCPGRTRCVAHAVEGSPSAALCAMAGELEAELLIVGTTRRMGAIERMVGSTAERVARGAEMPVLLLRTPLGRGAGRVLLATDLSSPSLHAMRTGISLARRLFPERVDFRSLHVITQQARRAPEPERLEDALQQMREMLAKAGFAVEEIDPKLRIGEPAPGIAEEAEIWGADLLVMGTLGRSGVSRLFFGSTASAAARRALCNVLVVPPPTAQ